MEVNLEELRAAYLRQNIQNYRAGQMYTQNMQNAFGGIASFE